MTGPLCLCCVSLYGPDDGSFIITKRCPVDATLFFKGLKPILDIVCEGVGVHAKESGGEGFEEAQALGELVPGTFGVVYTAVVEAYGDFDHGLVEVAEGVGGDTPKVFQGLVAVPKEARVEPVNGHSQGNWG